MLSSRQVGNILQKVHTLFINIFPKLIELSKLNLRTTNYCTAYKNHDPRFRSNIYLYFILLGYIYIRINS